MNRKSLSFRIPERTPTTRKRNTELDILSYGKKIQIYGNHTFSLVYGVQYLMKYFSNATKK